MTALPSLKYSLFPQLAAQFLCDYLKYFLAEDEFFSMYCENCILSCVEILMGDKMCGHSIPNAKVKNWHLVDGKGFSGGLVVKNLPAMQET